jgi:thioredoxin 1
MRNIKGNLKEILKENKRVVVDFWAPWCEPCVAFGPTFEKMSKKYPKVLFVKCNVDENQEIASANGIMSIPTLIFYNGEKEIERSIGMLPEEFFEKKIRSIFSE